MACFPTWNGQTLNFTTGLFLNSCINIRDKWYSGMCVAYQKFHFHFLKGHISFLLIVILNFSLVLRLLNSMSSDNSQCSANISRCWVPLWNKCFQHLFIIWHNFLGAAYVAKPKTLGVPSSRLRIPLKTFLPLDFYFIKHIRNYLKRTINYGKISLGLNDMQVHLYPLINQCMGYVIQIFSNYHFSVIQDITVH